MEQKVSTIKKLEAKKKDIYTMILFDSKLTADNMRLLEEFGFDSTMIDTFLTRYKNIGIVFRLKAIHENLSRNWKPFLDRVIKKGEEFGKLNNIFVNRTYDKILLVTNKRLFKIDLERLNKKIEEINYRIENYDERLDSELKEIEKTASTGFFRRLVEILKK